jgi:ubiquinone biosynthesis protein COQ4
MQTMTATSSTSTSIPVEDLTRLSPAVRWTRAARALTKVLADPDRTDQVLEFLSVVNSGPSTVARIERFFEDPVGRSLYEQRRAIDSRTIDIGALAALPAGTLGHAYAMFLRSHGLTPEVFDGSPPGITDPRRSYVVQRMRQTHDLWHVVTGCETDPAGEVALQAFTFAQVRSPGNAVLAIAGALRSAREKPGVLRDVVTYYRTGSRARRLPTFRWEDHWATPLSDVRTKLGLPVDPPARAAA